MVYWLNCVLTLFKRWLNKRSSLWTVDSPLHQSSVERPDEAKQPRCCSRSQCWSALTMLGTAKTTHHRARPRTGWLHRRTPCGARRAKYRRWARWTSADDGRAAGVGGGEAHRKLLPSTTPGRSPLLLRPASTTRPLPLPPTSKTVHLYSVRRLLGGRRGYTWELLQSVEDVHAVQAQVGDPGASKVACTRSGSHTLSRSAVLISPCDCCWTSMLLSKNK